MGPLSFINYLERIDSMEVKKSKYTAQHKWQAENLETIRIKPNKKLCIKFRLEQAAKAHSMSVTAYAVAAIETALDSDGLPRPTPDARQDDNTP